MPVSSPLFNAAPRAQARARQQAPFTLDCRMRHGRLAAKLETTPGGGALLEYRRDTAGRLIEVRRNGMVSERYAYDAAGRRSARLVANNEGQGTSRPLQGFQRDSVPLAAGGSPETYAYSPNGLLLQAGNTRYGWDAGGSLAWRLDQTLGAQGLALFDYRGGPLLRRAVLPGPTVIEYMYGPNGLPARRLKKRRPTHDFAWLPDGRLGGCIDYSRSLMLAFQHGASGPEQILVGILGAPGKSLLLRCWCDQIGTPRVLTAPDGTPIKEVEYDSFGNLLHDSNPALRLPLGFAGGLQDPDTGLIRFGWRDYDPRAGRFTAKDPARDLRGDGDLYDYCVDDPVSRRDPWGLSWTEATFDESKVKRDEDGKFAEKPSLAETWGKDAETLEKEARMREEAAAVFNRDGDPQSRERAEWLSGLGRGEGWSTEEDWINRGYNFNRPLPGTHGEFRNYTPQPKEFGWGDAFSKGWGNLESSGKSFVNDMKSAITHPVDTAVGVGKIVLGYKDQLLGQESEYRKYSNATTQYFSDRYGSAEKLKRAIAKDPIGVLADISSLLTGAGGLVRGAASGIQRIGVRALPAGGALVSGGVNAANIAGKTGKLATSVGGVLDPMYVPSLIAQRIMQQSQLARFSAPLSTAASRIYHLIQIGGTQQTIEKEQANNGRTSVAFCPDG